MLHGAAERVDQNIGRNGLLQKVLSPMLNAHRGSGNRSVSGKKHDRNMPCVLLQSVLYIQPAKPVHAQVKQYAGRPLRKLNVRKSAGDAKVLAEKPAARTSR